MKELLIGIVLLLIVGLGGFLYRNEVEQSKSSVASSTMGVACTAEASVCPDGSAVGRTGPNCSFAMCPPPNVEIQTGSSTIAFVLPEGYTQLTQGDTSSETSGQSNQSVLRTYQKPTTDPSTFSVLTISQATAGASSTPERVLKEGNNMVSEVAEGESATQVETAYYISTQNAVYKFDLTDREVQNATTTTMVDTLPEHQAILQMLSTLQVNSL